MTETALILLSLAAIHLAAVISPGPSFVVTVRTALRQGAPAALWLSLGLGIGTLVWAAAALFGLALLFQLVPWAYGALRLAGGLFLIWIAIGIWRGAAAPLPAPDASSPLPGSAARALRTGLAVQLANPKVAVFFGSVFVGLLPESPSPVLAAAALAIVFANEFGWYAVLSLAMTRGPVRAVYSGAKPAIDRLCGACLGLLGLRLAALP